MRRRSSMLLVVLAITSGASLATFACGGSSGSSIGDSTADDGGADGATASATASDPGAGDGTTPDAAPSAESVNDGGANIDPDAGGLDDAGPDGGACNAVANAAPAVTSSCISVIPTFGGGSLVAGTYYLESVQAIGGPAFCKNAFVPTGFRETVELTVSAGVGTAESAMEIGTTGLHHRTRTLTPGANDTSPAVMTPVCPASAAVTVRYESAVASGRQRLVVLGAYGSGTAVYTYAKQ